MIWDSTSTLQESYFMYRMFKCMSKHRCRVFTYSCHNTIAAGFCQSSPRPSISSGIPHYGIPGENFGIFQFH